MVTFAPMVMMMMMMMLGLATSWGGVRKWGLGKIVVLGILICGVGVYGAILDGLWWWWW